MSAHGHHSELPALPIGFAAPRLTLAAQILVGVGILGLIVAVVVGGQERLWSSILQGLLVPTYIGLAALFYLSIHYITNATWHTPLRRLMEGLTAGLWITPVAVLAVAVVGAPWLYDWVAEDGAAHAALFHIPGGSKSWYMDHTRFIATSAVFVGLWLLFRNRLIALSLRQDREPGCIQAAAIRWSIAYVMVFAITLTLFVWDLLLSLHVNWFSTMWGVYCFSSAVQTFLCVLTLLAVWLARGPLAGFIPKHTIHDLATWMVAWSCFCAYIGFSQYMLIYYANLDEETFWYIIRTQHGYGVLLFLDAMLRWPVCFLGLMSQKARTNPIAITVVCSLVLIGNWIDWSWLIMPAFSINEYRSPFFGPELLVGAGFAGGTLLLALRFWSTNGLLPRGEARLAKAVHAEHLH